MIDNVIRWFFILIENLFGWFRNMNVASLTFLLKFIRNHNIRSINVVSYDLCTDDSTNDSTCMYTNTHVQLWEIKFFSNELNMLNHGQTHIYNIFSFLQNISLITICESKNNVAITNCINFVDVIFQTFFIEFFEQFS